MTSKNRIGKRKGREIRQKLGKILPCICSGEQLSALDEMVPSSESLAIKNYSECADSLKAVEVEKKLDTGNIEEAESSLRESGCLNYEVGFCFLALEFVYLWGNRISFPNLHVDGSDLYLAPIVALFDFQVYKTEILGSLVKAISAFRLESIPFSDVHIFGPSFWLNSAFNSRPHLPPYHVLIKLLSTSYVVFQDALI